MISGATIKVFLWKQEGFLFRNVQMTGAGIELLRTKQKMGTGIEL